MKNMFFFFVVLTTAVLAFVLSCKADSVPVCEVPTSESHVTIDGQLQQDEWRQAAVLRRFFEPGQVKKASQLTEVYLQYDDTALYVGIACHENQSGYPEAYHRLWDDLSFTNDDAVMVVLGASDPLVEVQETINVGGYDGAMGGKKPRRIGITRIRSILWDLSSVHLTKCRWRNLCFSLQ